MDTIVTAGTRVRLIGTNIMGTVRAHSDVLDATYVTWENGGLSDEFPMEIGYDIEVVEG